MSSWQLVLLEPAKAILAQIGQFIINVLLVLIILVLGWIFSKFTKSVVVRILRSVKLDAFSEKIDLDNLLAKGGIKYSFSELIGVMIYWLMILVTFVIAFNAAGLTIVADLLNRVIQYVPKIIIALFILISGMFIATFLKNIVQTMATNAGLSQDKVLGKLVEVLVMVVAILIALEQLEIGTRISELTWGIILGSIGFAFALAFGLGCKDLMGKFVSEFLEKLNTKK